MMKAFFSKYNDLTHTLAAVWLVVSGAYASSDDFREAVNALALQVYHSLPHGAATVVSSLAGILVPLWAFYRKGNPSEKNSGSQSSGAGKAAMIALALLVLASPAIAQTPSPAPPSPAANLYAAGVSYNQAGTPAVAVSALYAHRLDISPDSFAGPTYVFTMVDVLPNNTKPLTVSTNIGAGIAQKAFSIAGHDVLVPTAAGISLTGSNAGWSWTTGAAVPIRFKGNWFLVPTVRVLKSSVTGGTGYQPVFGILLGLGS